MIKAVFLDLDNTLLHNPDRGFAIEYLRLADAYFSQHHGYTNFAETLRQTIPAIINSDAPSQSNHSVASNLLAEQFDVATAIIDQQLQSFYQTEFPKLKNCTASMSEAELLINLLNEHNYQVVIATNPIYPAIAVQQRLNWAGISDQILDYAFVTHSQNMHFAKPRTEYYAELLARVGVEPDETLMVGDSLKNDIVPAKTLGIHTFHISTHSEESNSGNLGRFIEKVKENWLETLNQKHLIADAIIPQLRGNLGALFGLLETVEPAYWLQQPDPNEWSILQILCHLVDSENSIQRPRIKQILNQDTPFLVSPKPPIGADAVICANNGFEVANHFMAERMETIEFLNLLVEDDWQKQARHSIFGMTNLLEMAHFTAQHDRLHLTQLCRTIGNCE